jgi:hypothetical protein
VAQSERRAALRRRLQEIDGIDPDDVIMSPDRARSHGLTSTVCFPGGQSRAGGIGDQSTAIDPRWSARTTFIAHGPGARLRHRGGGNPGHQGRRISQGDVMVLICSGPAGAGMQEIYQITSALKQLPHCKHVAVLTDARFSGVSTGACIGHISPEALAGGPIGKVRDGDQIEIVDRSRSLPGSVNLSAKRARFSAPKKGARLGSSAVPRPDLLRILKCPPTRASGRRWSGQRRRLGRLRLRRRSNCLSIGEKSVKLYRTGVGCLCRARRPLLSRAGDLAGTRCLRMTICRDICFRSSKKAMARSCLRARFFVAQILAPIGSQEVWAAGVTYFRSRSARMAESKDAGGGDFYDRVYTASVPSCSSRPRRAASPDPGSTCAFAAMPSGRFRSRS